MKQGRGFKLRALHQASGAVPKLCPDPAFLPVLARLALIVFCNLQRIRDPVKVKSPSPHQIKPFQTAAYERLFRSDHSISSCAQSEGTRRSAPRSTGML